MYDLVLSGMDGRMESKTCRLAKLSIANVRTYLKFSSYRRILSSRTFSIYIYINTHTQTRSHTVSARHFARDTHTNTKQPDMASKTYRANIKKASQYEHEKTHNMTRRRDYVTWERWRKRNRSCWQMSLGSCREYKFFATSSAISWTNTTAVKMQKDSHEMNHRRAYHSKYAQGRTNGKDHFTSLCRCRHVWCRWYTLSFQTLEIKARGKGQHTWHTSTLLVGTSHNYYVFA